MNVNLTAAEYAKHLGMVPHLQSSKEEDIRARARAARLAGVTACYMDSFWTPVVTEELQGSNARVGTAISFPYGCTSTDMKFAEIEEDLRLGTMAVDMVVNIGRLREGDGELARRRVERLVERMRGTVLPKVTFEVYFLTDEETVRFTKIRSNAGIDYVRTTTESQGFPAEVQVQVMQDSITNGSTKLEVPGVPRTFIIPATLWMTEQLGVSLIGTWSAVSLVQQHATHLGIN